MKILEEKDKYLIVTYDDLNDEFEEWYLAECYLITPNGLRCTSCFGGIPRFAKEVKNYLEEKLRGAKDERWHFIWHWTNDQ